MDITKNILKFAGIAFALWFNTIQLAEQFTPTTEDGVLLDYCVERPDKDGVMSTLCYNKGDQSNLFRMMQEFPRPVKA